MFYEHNAIPSITPHLAVTQTPDLSTEPVQSHLSHPIWLHQCFACDPPVAKPCIDRGRVLLFPYWINRNSSYIKYPHECYAQHQCGVTAP